MSATADPKTASNPKLLPPYHVLIEDDDHHSQMFVVVVLRKVFGFDESKAVDLMHTAEKAGEAIVWTGAKEVAELRLEQLLTYHEKQGDLDLGPLGCRLEPAA